MNEFLLITFREEQAFGMLCVPMEIQGNQHSIGWTPMRTAVRAAMLAVEAILAPFAPEYVTQEITRPQEQKPGAPVHAVVQVLVHTEQSVPPAIQADCTARAVIVAGLIKAGNAAPLLDAFGPGLPEHAVIEVERMLPGMLAIAGGKRFDVPVTAEGGGKSIHLEGTLARKPPPARPEDTRHPFEGLLVRLDLDGQTISLKIPGMKKRKVQYDRDTQFPDIFRFIEGGRGSPVPVRGQFVATSDARGKPCNRLEWVELLQGDKFALL